MALTMPESKFWDHFYIPKQPPKGTQIFGHFSDFGHFLIEIPIEVEKNYLHGKERSKSKNKNSSEICEHSRTTWQHAQFKIINFSQ